MEVELNWRRLWRVAWGGTPRFWGRGGFGRGKIGGSPILGEGGVGGIKGRGRGRGLPALRGGFWGGGAFEPWGRGQRDRKSVV